MKYRAFSEGKLRLVVAALVLAGLGYASSLQDNAKVSAQTAPYTLTVQEYDSQPGQHLSLARITSSPAGIDCGLGHTDCSATFSPGGITLIGDVNGNNDIDFRWWHPVIYSPNAGFVDDDQFCTEFIDAPHSNDNSCTGAMPNTNVTIRFSASYIKSTLEVGTSGDGSGTVSDQNPPKSSSTINCGSKCSEEISDPLTLFAIPDPGSTFAGWSINGSPAGSQSSVHVSPRGDGQKATYIAIFNKISAAGSVMTADTARTNGQVKGAKTDKRTDKTPPEAPKASIQVNGKTFGPGEKVFLQSNQSLKLSGKTVPNGKVTLYLFSDPQVFSTMADPEGYWEYEIASVPPGDHHIEAEVTDPVTNKTSERTYVTDLNVDKINEMAPQINTNSVRESGIRSMVIGAAIAAAVIVATAVVSISVYHRHKLPRVRAQVSRRLKTVKRRK
jgi:hypothetical protein